MDTGYYIVGLIIAAFLGLIPASIAKRKGYSFGLWWFYGWMLFLIAIIHVSLIPDKCAQQTPINPYYSTSNTLSSNVGLSAADELKKYKDLFDAGVISSEEFHAKKEQLLNLL